MRNTLLGTLSLLALSANAITAQGAVTRSGAAAGSRRVLIDTAGTLSGAQIRLDTSRTVYSFSANHARIGIRVSLVSSSNDAFGAVVDSVMPKGPAEKAGLRVGDIIMKVNDVTIGNSGASGSASGVFNVGTKLVSTLSVLQPGVPANLQIRRGTETLTLKVTPEKDDSQMITTVIGPQGRMTPESLSAFMKLMPGMPTLRDGQVIFEDKTFSLPAGIDRTMAFRTSFDALSRLELAPLNPELGSYFGATEGVLVISIAPPGMRVEYNIAPSMIRPQGGGAGGGAVAAGGTGARGGAAVMTAPRNPAAAGAVAPKATTESGTTSGSTELLNLKPGDVITAVDARKVSTPADLMRILRSYQRGDELKITVLRQKKSTVITAKMPAE